MKSGKTERLTGTAGAGVSACLALDRVTVARERYTERIRSCSASAAIWLVVFGMGRDDLRRQAQHVRVRCVTHPMWPLVAIVSSHEAPRRYKTLGAAGWIST